MAKIISTSISGKVAVANYVPWQNALLGAFLGSLYFLLIVLIDPLTKSASVPGDVATIIVATVSVVIMVHYKMAQPLIIATAVALSLWGMTYLTSGLTMWETFAWSVILYTLGYLAFSWIARYTKLLPVLILVVSVIIMSRIAASL